MGKSAAKYPAHTRYETVSVFWEVWMVNAEVEASSKPMSLEMVKFINRINALKIIMNPKTEKMTSPERRISDIEAETALKMISNTTHCEKIEKAFL